jgi:hypothetical protein
LTPSAGSRDPGVLAALGEVLLRDDEGGDEGGEITDVRLAEHALALADPQVAERIRAGAWATGAPAALLPRDGQDDLHRAYGVLRGADIRTALGTLLAPRAPKHCQTNPRPSPPPHPTAARPPARGCSTRCRQGARRFRPPHR